MFGYKYYILLGFCCFALATFSPTGNATAGARDAAIAAGIVGAVIGGAILMQGAQGAQQYRAVRRKKISAPSRESSAKAKDPKDPFANATTPAGYATPVSDK